MLIKLLYYISRRKFLNSTLREVAMPSVLIAKLEETREGGKNKITILQPEIPSLVMNILCNHFGGSVTGTYVGNRRWLHDLPQEVRDVLKKLYRVHHSLGITTYDRDEDLHGLTRNDHGEDCDCGPEEFPITEGVVVVWFREKPYLLAQWRSDNRPPTPIPEMKKSTEERLERDINPKSIYLEGLRQISFTFVP